MATKKLKDLTTVELLARLKAASGRAYKATNRTWLIEKITEAEAAKAKATAIAKTKATTARAPRRGANVTAPAPEAPTPPDEETDADAAPSEAPARDAPAAARKGRTGRWSAMTLEALQAMYVATVGRDTQSLDRGYLVWKIREAEKGRVRTGPVTSRAKGEPATPVTMRIADATLGQLDQVWKRLGYRSRLQLLAHAITLGLVELGESAVAGGFLPHGPAMATGATGGAR